MRYAGASLVLSVLLAPLAAHADIPVVLPDGMYVDEDAGASYLPVWKRHRADFRRALNATIHANPRNSVALAHRAFLFARDGNADLARRDFEAALAVALPGSEYERQVLWSRGWAHYEAGDFEGALTDWRNEIALHGGHPYWAAYTFALLYWSDGQRDVALAWYAVAAASDRAWSGADGLAACTSAWTPQQQASIRAAFAAWQQQVGAPARSAHDAKPLPASSCAAARP